MTQDLTDIIALVQSESWSGFLVFLRVGAAIALLPALGERVVSVRVRLGLALALTFIIAPIVNAGMPEATTLANFAWFLATETIAGLALGAMLRMFIFAIQTAGAIAAQATSLAQLLGGASTEPLPAIGHVLTVAALALLMIYGFHFKVAQFLAGSYLVIPAGEFANPMHLTRWGVTGVANTFSLAFQLAAPFVILSVLYNLALGAINRAMPQLMVAFVGAPVITFGAIALLFLVAPVLLQTWIQAVDAFLRSPLGPIQ